jgi:hypothetical protein
MRKGYADSADKPYITKRGSDTSIITAYTLATPFMLGVPNIWMSEACLEIVEQRRQQEPPPTRIKKDP